MPFLLRPLASLTGTPQNFLDIGFGDDLWNVDLVSGECRIWADSNSCPDNEINEFAFHAITCELIILEIDWEAQPLYLRFASSLYIGTSHAYMPVRQARGKVISPEAKRRFFRSADRPRKRRPTREKL